jgi:hypothetical protein
MHQPGRAGVMKAIEGNIGATPNIAVHLLFFAAGDLDQKKVLEGSMSWRMIYSS